MCSSDLLPGGSDSKESAHSAGDQGSIPGSGRSPGKGNGNPLWYSCLENPMDSSCQVSLPTGFSGQEHWSRLPFPPPGDLPDPGIEPWSPALQADSLPSKPPGKPLKFGTFLHNTKSFSVLSCPVFSSIVTLEVFHVLLYLK